MKEGIRPNLEKMASDMATGGIARQDQGIWGRAKFKPRVPSSVLQMEQKARELTPAGKTFETLRAGGHLNEMAGAGKSSLAEEIAKGK